MGKSASEANAKPVADFDLDSLPVVPLGQHINEETSADESRDHCDEHQQNKAHNPVDDEDLKIAHSKLKSSISFEFN